MHHLIANWPDQIRRHGAWRGLDEGFDRHPSDELEARQARNFTLRHRNTNGEVRGLDLRSHRRDPADLAIKLGRRALAEG
jgi:hypothetical protein